MANQSIKDFQTKVVQSKGWLSLCSMARIYDLWDGSLDKHKVPGLALYYIQVGHRAQELQHPIDAYRYISQYKQNYPF